jgi:hypothetical protein
MPVWLALVLAGCSSSGSGTGGFTTVAGGLAATAEVAGTDVVVSDAPEGDTSATVNYDDETGQVTLDFTGGSLDGRRRYSDLRYRGQAAPADPCFMGQPDSSVRHQSAKDGSRILMLRRFTWGWHLSRLM